MTAGDLTDLILYRVRSTGGFAFTSTFARQILSLAQATTQAHLKRLLKTVDFTLVPEKPVYDTAVEFTDMFQITCMEYARKHISEAKDWRELSRVNSNWLRAHAQAPSMFAQIGFHFLAVTPTPQRALTVQLTYVLETPELTGADSVMLLPDEDVTFCADLAELVLLMASARGTKLSEAVAKGKQLMQRTGITMPRISGEREI